MAQPLAEQTQKEKHQIPVVKLTLTLDRGTLVKLERAQQLHGKDESLTQTFRRAAALFLFVEELLARGCKLTMQEPNGDIYRIAMPE